MDKKIPQRMCIVCRRMFDKKDLVRIQSIDGVITIDFTGKKNGRGAYVCKTGCASKMEKTHALERTFKTKIEKNVYEELIKEFDSFAE